MMSRHLSLLLVVVPVVNSLHIQCLYQKLPPGHSVTGISGRSYDGTAECSLRCTLDSDCNGYYLQKVDPHFCRLIRGNEKVEEGSMFIADEHSNVFKKDLCDQNAGEDKEATPAGCVPSDTWTPPGGWNGSLPVVYRSFDTLHFLQEMEGTVPSQFGALVTGKINTALKVNHTLRQWVDLGNLSVACITIPDTCGPEGAAIAFWLRVTYCRGLFASRAHTTGLMFFCSRDSPVVSFRVFLAEGYFNAWKAIPAEWTHVVVNYIGPNDGEGIRLYYNGTQVATDTTHNSQNQSAGNGNVVFGRYITTSNTNYGSAEMDELVFFNRKLTEAEIEDVYSKDL